MEFTGHRDIGSSMVFRLDQTVCRLFTPVGRVERFNQDTFLHHLRCGTMPIRLTSVVVFLVRGYSLIELTFDWSLNHGSRLLDAMEWVFARSALQLVYTI